MGFKLNRRCCALSILVLLVLVLHVLVTQSEARTLVREDHAQEKVGLDPRGPRRVARDPRWDERYHRWDRGGWNINGGWDKRGSWNSNGGWNNRPPWPRGNGGGHRK